MRRIFDPEDNEENNYMDENMEEWEEFDDDDEEDLDEDFLDDDNIIHLMEMKLAKYDNNRKLMGLAFEFAQKSFLWKFLSYKNRIKIFVKTYKIMKKVIDKDKDKED